MHGMEGVMAVQVMLRKEKVEISQLELSAS